MSGQVNGSGARARLDSEDDQSDKNSTYRYLDDMESNDGGGDRRVSAWVNNDALNNYNNEEEEGGM